MKILKIGLVFLILSGCHAKARNDIGESLPAFNLQLCDSISMLNTAKIPTGRPIVLLYFSPDCEHCQKETRDILQNMQALKDVRFYFITNDPLENMQTFNRVFQLDSHPNIVIARDYSFFIPAHFKNASPPYMIIYDRDKKQRALFNGETPAAKVINFLNTIS